MGWYKTWESTTLWSFSSPFQVTIVKFRDFRWDGNLIFGALIVIKNWKCSKSNLETYQYTGHSHPIDKIQLSYPQTKVCTSWTFESALIMLVRDVLRSLGCCAWLCAVLPSDRFGSKVRLFGGAIGYVTPRQGTVLQLHKLYIIVIFYRVFL